MVAISAEKRMQYKLFFHEARLLLVLFIATHFWLAKISRKISLGYC